MTAFAVLGCALLVAIDGPHVRKEAWYQERAQRQLGGVREVPVTRGRIDLLTTNMAIEVEFFAKFKEGIGQSLWYAWQTGQCPGLALIVTKADMPDYRMVRDKITNHSAIAVLRIDTDTGVIGK
jgi:hypothetical protein